MYAEEKKNPRWDVLWSDKFHHSLVLMCGTFPRCVKNGYIYKRLIKYLIAESWYQAGRVMHARSPRKGKGPLFLIPLIQETSAQWRRPISRFVAHRSSVIHRWDFWPVRASLRSSKPEYTYCMWQACMIIPCFSTAQRSTSSHSLHHSIHLLPSIENSQTSILILT